MSLLAIRAKRSVPEMALERFDQLAVALSARLTRLSLEGTGPVIADALAQVAAALSIDACRLVEFSESGSVARTHTPARTTNGSDVQQETPSPDERLVARLARGETVIISPAGDPTAAAFVSRERAAPRANACFVLGLPAAVSGQVVCALVIESGRVPRQWSEPLIGQLQLIAEILGAAVQRWRHEMALRSSVAEIQRLNAKLQADNVYLKEEIKSYHDVDEIVGESAPLRLALARLAQVAPVKCRRASRHASQHAAVPHEEARRGVPREPRAAARSADATAAD